MVWLTLFRTSPRNFHGWRNGLLRHMAEEVFGLPVRISESQEEAALGAAWIGVDLM